MKVNKCPAHLFTGRFNQYARVLGVETLRHVNSLSSFSFFVSGIVFSTDDVDFLPIF